MKKLKPVSLRTIVLGRTGEYTPLSVSSGETEATQIQGDHEISVFSPEAQTSGEYRRNINAMSNWDKIRENLLNANVEGDALPENSGCLENKDRRPKTSKTKTP